MVKGFKKRLSTKWGTTILIMILLCLSLSCKALFPGHEGMVRDSTEHLLPTFTATQSGDQIILAWSTQSESEMLGFNLFRSESREGEYTRINPDFIMAASTNAGSKYQFIDKNIQNGTTYFYKLEQIDIKGTGTMYGPVSVTPK